jgi:2-polyprenyl-3-methyl-5-hydroxy-6-metoxy-1,4-benzoquinol methylase
MSAQPFPETADIETSSDDYATRFAGSAGQWMLEVQERLTLDVLAGFPGASVLDVGGGHGQITRPLCRAGHAVTVLGSAESCRHRIADLVEAGRCRFDVGNVVELPYSDHSFDVVVSFRLLTHCERWPQLVAELCRVARRAVVVDYPTSQSVNAIAPALFGAKKRIEKNTRTWRLFRHDEVREAFAHNGYALAEQRKQFFLPMVLHRALGRRALCAAIEAAPRALGLTALFGSPVIVRMEPGHPRL